MPQSTNKQKATARLVLLDEVRGFTIVSMVLFHAAYDAAYLYGYDLAWFQEPIIQNVWRCSISWVFLLLAGWMTAYSRSNARRATRYALCALLVFAATAVASVDTAVTFGILFCMAASTAVYCVAEPALKRVPPALGLFGTLALFGITYAVPHARYAVEGLAWLGCPSPTFSSGDYYPLLPYLFMYLAGAFCQRLFMERYGNEPPAAMTSSHCGPLALIGRHSLEIYLVHQPLLIVLFEGIRLIAP